MGIIIRQSILTSLISYVGVAIGYVNLLYLYPKFLEVEQVGLLRAIQDTAMLFAPFALFGLGQSIIKYYPHFGSEDAKRNNFLTFIFTLALLAYGIFLVAFFTFQDLLISLVEKNAGEIIPYIGLILWLTFFLLFINLLEQYSRSLLNVALPTFLRDIAVRVFQAALVLLYYVKVIDFHQFIQLSVGVYLIILLVLASYLFFKSGYRITWRFADVIGTKRREIFRFSALSFVGTSAMILIGKMDSVMVLTMLGTTSTAIFTTAFYMATVIEIPKRAITTTASPLIAAAFERGDVAAIKNLYVKTSINQFIVGALLFIGIWANLSNLFDLMPKGEIYRAGLYVVGIVGAGKLIDMTFGPSSEIIGLSKHYWFNLVVITILAGIVILCNYLLIPRYGIEGAAYGSVIALFIYNFTKFLFIFYKFRLQPFTINTIKVIVISGVVFLLNSWLPSASTVILDIFYRSIVITVSFGTLILLWKPSEEVNKLFYRVVGRLKN
jgi:O-antigen/teichoic acid export membrane protein